MQKILPISIFILLNTLLSPIITNFIAILYLGSIIVVDDPKEVITPYIYILTVFFIMRIIILPIFYTLTKSTNSILQNFFNLLKKNNIYTILFLLFIFFIDIAISYIFLYIIDKKLISFNTFLFNYFIGGFGLLFAYLSLLCWIRIIEEKFCEKSLLNIIICLIYTIMFILTLVIITML